MVSPIGTRTLELGVGCDHQGDTSGEVTKIPVTLTEKEEEKEVDDPPSTGLVGAIAAIGTIAGMMRGRDRR